MPWEVVDVDRRMVQAGMIPLALSGREEAKSLDPTSELGGELEEDLEEDFECDLPPRTLETFGGVIEVRWEEDAGVSMHWVSLLGA